MPKACRYTRTTTERFASVPLDKEGPSAPKEEL